jgi:hypothetical protein
MRPRDLPGPIVVGFDPIEFREGDLEHRHLPVSTDSGSGSRTSQHDRLTMARSPSGERCPLTSRWATVPLLEMAGASAVTTLAMSHVGCRRRWGREIMARVMGEWAAAPHICYVEKCSWPLILDGPFTSHLGWIRPRWASGKAAQAFAVFCQVSRGLGRTGFGL